MLVSNAMLQWVPGRLDLLPRLAARVPPGGWLAFAVRRNFAEQTHRLRDEQAARAPYAAYLAGVTVPSAHGAAPLPVNLT